jgi:putative holliday junction resolvase
MQGLAFDFGMKYIGVAVGGLHYGGIQRQPSILAKEGEPDWLALDKLVLKWQPECFVVGIPLHMNGSEQWITHQARAFKNKLMKKYPQPTFEIDERLSTDEAKRRLIDARVKGVRIAERKRFLDSMSAQIILEQFFHEQLREEAEHA